MKKFLSILLAFLLTFSLAGCTKKTIFKRRHLTKRCLGDSHNCLVLILGRQQISGYGR